MKITDELSRRISELIQVCAIDPSSDPPRLRKLIIEQKVLPLYWSMSDLYAINARGEVLSVLWDTLHARIESDLRSRNIALFQGSKKYPELVDLIEKPDDAIVCPHCGGTGIDRYAAQLKTDAILCYCGGLGWVPLRRGDNDRKDDPR
jgi:hypothetical protein